jgi:hypothetical protein
MIAELNIEETMSKSVRTSFLKAVLSISFFYHAQAAVDLTLPISKLLPQLQLLTGKFKLSPDDLSDFNALVGYFSAKVSQLTPEQIQTYRDSLNMAYYGMVFEAATKNSSDSNLQAIWTKALEPQVNQLSGSTTSATVTAQPTNTDFTAWINYLSGQISQYKILQKDQLTDLLASQKLMVFSGTNSIVANISSLVDRRMETPLVSLKNSANLSVNATQDVSAAAPLQDGYQLLQSDSTKSFMPDLEDLSQSWPELKALIADAIIVAALDSNPGKTDPQPLTDLATKLSQPITFAERLTALVNLTKIKPAAGATTDITSFEIRLAKIIDGATTPISDADKKTIIDTITLFYTNNKITTTPFDFYVRALAQGKKAADIFDPTKTYAILWAEQDGTDPAQKYWQANPADKPTQVQLIDNNPLNADCYFKAQIVSDSEVALYLDLGSAGKYFLNNLGALTKKDTPATDGTETFFAFGSKDALSLKSKAEGAGFVTVNAGKTLETKDGDNPAGSMSDAGILEPGDWGIYKLVEITPLHTSLAQTRKLWTDGPWTITPDDAAKAATDLATKITAAYKTTIATLANQTKNATDANAQLVINELSAFVTAAFRADVAHWGWFNSGTLSAQLTTLLNQIKSIFAKPLAQQGLAAAALTEFDTMITTAPDAIVNAIAVSDSFDYKIQSLQTELQRYNNNDKDTIKQLLEQKKLTPFTGKDSLVQSITDALPRRMETALCNLQTSAGATIDVATATPVQNNVAIPSAGYRSIDATTETLKDLEDPTKSWQPIRDLMTAAKQVAYTDKAQIPLDQQKLLTNMFFDLEKQLAAPITTTERVLALKKLVETEAIQDIMDGSTVKLSAIDQFEIRLSKLVDSISSEMADADKQAVVDLIDRFCVVTKDAAGKSLDKSQFADYIRILTQGRHPSELFTKDEIVAFLWAEQDGTDPVQKYWQAQLSTDATPQPTLIKLVDDNLLNGNCHFKIFITDNSEVVLYMTSSDAKTNYVLKNDGTLSKKDPTAADDTEKFYSYGSKEAFSLKSKIDGNGFVTVGYDKTLKTLQGDKPAGKANADGTLEPGVWALFKIVDISPLHQELLTARNKWFSKDWIADREADQKAQPASVATQTLAGEIIDDYGKVITEMDNSGQDTDFNVDLILREIIGFVTAAFRASPDQWDWLSSSGSDQKIATLKTLIKKAFSEALGTAGLSKKSYDNLEQCTTIAPEESLAPFEDAPKNGAVVTLHVMQNDKEMYLRISQETDAQGEHFYLKADVEDPVDVRCHLQVIAQGNKLGFASKGSDGSIITLQYVPRTDADLKRYWQDATGQAAIKRMTRLEFLPAGKGDLNSKDRAVEQFMMDYYDKTAQNLVYVLNNMGTGAGVLLVNSEGYATVVKVDQANKKLTTTAKTDGDLSKIKILPISGFLTDLGSLRSQADPLKSLTNYTAKIDLAETNDDIEFLVMEFENFLEAKQAVRQDWLQLVANPAFTQGVNDFLTKIQPKVDADTSADGVLKAALSQLKQTYVQMNLTDADLTAKAKEANETVLTDDQKFSAAQARVFAIKWVNPDGGDIYLMTDGLTGNLTATADSFNDPACHFQAEFVAPADPLDFTLKIKSTLTNIATQASTQAQADDYLASRQAKSTATATTSPPTTTPAVTSATPAPTTTSTSATTSSS